MLGHATTEVAAMLGQIFGKRHAHDFRRTHPRRLSKFLDLLLILLGEFSGQFFDRGRHVDLLDSYVLTRYTQGQTLHVYATSDVDSVAQQVTLRQLSDNAKAPVAGRLLQTVYLGSSIGSAGNRSTTPA